MWTAIAILAVGVCCFGVGVLVSKRAKDLANEGELKANAALSDAKTEYEKLKSGARHRLDQILG